MAGRETLLIAENSIENRTILAEIFSEEYELIEVEDGVRALTLLREKTEEIFAVLLDVALPLADGFAVLEEMKRDPRLETIPVVMMTALDEPQNEVRALQHGATDFVVKPFVPEVIFQRVRNVVRQRKLERYLSEKMLMELDYRANHDPLTGIYNKEAFYRMTAELLQKNPSRKFVLLRWNIERFKLINELFGKEVGDRILRQLAENFQKKLTTIGTYGRLEADHFAICLPAKYLDAPLFLVQTGELMGKLDIPYTVTVAFGIYEIDDPDIPVDQMCDRANLALQTIKGKYKRHYALYNDTMRQTMLREQEIRGEMAEALATRQFQVFLQPIYSLSADRTVSAEALVRWTHPRKGTISPGEFIPLFEKSGFISELDHYVWEEACRYLKQRRERGLAPLPISVNASRMSLYSPDLFREIVELTEKYGVEPALFKLEITETAYAADPAQLMQTTRKLQAAGFSVLMDDFGSGYSSLNTLKDLPVDILKIDMKFLDGFESGGRVGTVLISVLRMAKWLNLPVIAEGVETKEQLAFLRSVGCDLIQGFCVAKPMAMEGFEDYIEETHLGVETSEELLFSGEDFDAVLGGNRLINRLMEGMFGGFGLYEYNEDYIEILRANDGYYSLLGYTPETLTADSRDIWVHTFAEDVGQAKAACREAISTGKAVRLVLRRYHKDGRLLYLDTIVRHLGGGSQGTLLCIAFNDITQQLENERRMQEKQERYRLISESAGAVVLEWDFRTKAFTASEGYEAFQISRQDPFTLCDTVFASTDEAAVCQLEKWDGTAVWCRVARTDVREKTGEIVRSIASITNVDAEKRAEQQLLYRDQLAQILLADSDTLTFDYYTGTDCIQVNYVDRAGGRANRTIPQFRRFVLRAHMVHPDDRLLLLQMTDATCSMEGSLEFRGEFRGHSYRWYRLTYASLSDENGKVHRIVGKAVDITESRKVESRYREELDFTRALGVGLVSSCRVNLTTKCIEYSRGEGRVSQLPVNAPMSDALFLRHADEFLVDSGERASYGAKFCPSKLLADYENGVTEQEMEYRARMEDDTVRWLHLRVKLLKKPDTSEVVAFYNTWDIHEKHVAREVIDSVVTLDYDYLMYIRAGDHNYALFPSKKADGHTVSTGGNYDEECRHRIATALHREDRRRAV
ncbi:MAG: EAL domain-containing protein, partial [Oscillospiraceae bacterium]